jgi:hypothetical protein
MMPIPVSLTACHIKHTEVLKSNNNNNNNNKSLFPLSIRSLHGVFKAIY